jgi:phage terminase small subunit
MSKPADRPLTPKQARFVEEYVLDLNASRAAIRAGYSSRTADVQGPRLLGNVRIKRAIAEATAHRSERTAITADYVLSRLRTIGERCLQAEPVLDRAGHPTGQWRFDSAGANRAFELLGKHLRLFVDRAELSGPDGGPVTFEAALSSLATLDHDERAFLRRILERRAGVASESGDGGDGGGRQA